MTIISKRISTGPVCLISILVLYITASISVMFCQVIPANASEKVSVETLAVLSGDELMGRFDRASGIFYDSIKNRIYVADSANKRLVSFDSSFRFLADLRDEKIEMPLSLVKDSSGIFYVVDGAKRSILSIDVKKKLIEELIIKGEFHGREQIFPGKIAIDGKDRLYITDKLHRRIVVLDKFGLYIKEITVNDEDFYGFNDVKVYKNGDVYALDTIGGAVYIFGSDGSIISKFGDRNGKKQSFRFPVSLALDDNGFVYVLDSHASKVQVFDNSGTYRRTLFKNGANEGELMHPTYLYIDHKNRIFIADQSRIQIFREGKE